MKKILFLLSLVALTVFLALPVSAEVNFSDVDNSHWAYEYIQKLVDFGTINGYSDGTFKPDAPVKRAEFVKMLGQAETDLVSYKDISSHWAKDYIEKSGIVVNDENFYPDIEISRIDALDFMWQLKNYGNSAKDDTVKLTGILSAQIDIPYYVDAVKWAYTNGILIGDDGINLRLTDKISRAEAVSLILRAKEKLGTDTKITSMAQTVPDEVLSNLYTKLSVFDSEYEKDAYLTNGELCVVATKIIYGKNEVMLPVNEYNDNVLDSVLYISQLLYDGDLDVEKFAEENATHKTATEILSFAYAYSFPEGNALNKTNNIYPNIEAPKNFLRNMALTFAYTNKLFVNFNENLSDSAITKSELSALLLQLEDIVPSFESYASGKAKAEKIDYEKLLYSDELNEAMPLSSMPYDAYKAPFSEGSVTDGLKNSKDYSDVFSKIVSSLNDYLYKDDIKFVVRYYPSLVSVSDNNTILRVRIYCAENQNEKTAKQIFTDVKCDDFVIDTNKAYILDISTGKNFGVIFTNPLEDFIVEQLIWSEN